MEKNEIQCGRTLRRAAIKAAAVVSLLLTAASAGAERGVEIVLMDGTVVACPFSVEPVMTFNNGVVTLESRDATGSWSVSDIDYWHFDEVEGVETVESDTRVDIRIVGGHVIVNAPQGTPVTVCTPEGVVVARTATDASGTADIDMCRLNAPVIIVAAGGRSVKLAKFNRQ